MTSVVTFSQARCVSCDVAHADGRAFSLRAVNRMFSFAAFFTACVTLCVIRYDLLRIHTMRRRIGDRSAGGSVPIPSQLDRARTRFSTKIGSITSSIVTIGLGCTVWPQCTRMTTNDQPTNDVTTQPISISASFTKVK